MTTRYERILKKKVFGDSVIQIARVLNTVYIKEGTFSLTDPSPIPFKDVIVEEAIKKDAPT